jgi:hypothetical protein
MLKQIGSTTVILRDRFDTRFMPTPKPQPMRYAPGDVLFMPDYMQALRERTRSRLRGEKS